MSQNFAERFTQLPEPTVRNVDTFLAACSDVGLCIDHTDTVIEVFASDASLKDITRNWVGKPVSELLTVESLPKMRELLGALRENSPTRRRQVNHPLPGEDDLPVTYGGWLLDDSGHVALCGQDLRPMASLQARLVASQQSLERDYERMRKMEARYRMLFQDASDAFLIVDASDNRIVEANPRASQMLGVQPSELAGRKLSQIFAKSDRVSIDATLAGVMASARSETTSAGVEGTSTQRLVLHAKLFRAAATTLFMVRLTAANDDSVSGQSATDDNATMLLERAMDGVVLADEHGRIVWTNPAFLDLTQLAMREHALNAPLSEYLGRTDVDFTVLMSNAKRYGRVRSFSTTCRGAGGLITDVDVAAIALPNGAPPGYGFVVRDISMQVTGEESSSDGLPRSAEQLTELIGRMPLRDVVRTATDVIEKMCIETALRMTGDNRASAAEMLGLSRQSLYVKLRRYDLGDLKDN
ncbi:MAG: transcriptional regulator PpsR [Pseudomonadota bacterium]